MVLVTFQLILFEFKFVSFISVSSCTKNPNPKMLNYSVTPSFNNVTDCYTEGMLVIVFHCLSFGPSYG